MAGEDGRGCRSPQTVAVILVLSCLAQSVACFSLQWLSGNVKQGELASEATVMEVRTGNILFNGKELKSQSGSAFAAAAGNDVLLQTNLDESHGSGTLEQTFQLEDALASEEAWRRLNFTLHCGPVKMKLKGMGPGASRLKLDMGDASPLPLTQVPETCHFSVKQTALGLVLEVPYNGCNVTQEDGNYLLPMRWLDTPVKFTCPMLTSSASTTLKPAQQPWQLPVPHGLLSLNRRKRQAYQNLPIYDPRHPYYRYWYYNYYYYYYLYMMRQTPAPSTATTTANPDTTTSTVKPPYMYYPYYYPYYYYYPNTQVTTTAPPTTTASSTGGMTTTAETTTPPMTSSASTPTTAPTTLAPTTVGPTTLAPTTVGPTTLAPTTLAPTTVGPTTLAPTTVGPTTLAPTTAGPTTLAPTTAGPTTLAPTTAGPTTLAPTTAGPTTLAPTTAGPTTLAPTTAGPTTSPTPAVDPTPAPPSTLTSKPCTTKPSDGVYPGPMKPYVPYDQLQFVPYVAYNKAGNVPYDLKSMPQAGYKSGPGARAQPPPHPGFSHWQPAHWFPQQTGQDHNQFDWQKSAA